MKKLVCSHLIMALLFNFLMLAMAIFSDVSIDASFIVCGIFAAEHVIADAIRSAGEKKEN